MWNDTLKREVKISRLTFQHNFWFICGPWLLFWCCPTRFETRALSALWKQYWIKSLLEQTLPVWSNKQNNILKLAHGHKWHVTPVVIWTPRNIYKADLEVKAINPRILALSSNRRLCKTCCWIQDLGEAGSFTGFYNLKYELILLPQFVGQKS